MEQSKKQRIVSGIDPKYSTKNWRTKSYRFAPYLRVSTDSSDQENSLKNQRRHYERFALDHPNWELVDTYADEGISGTSTRNRTEFRRMVEDCKKGYIDLIVVKDVSRFARNITDCLNTAQELLTLDPPVGIYFESHNMNTLDTGNRAFLTMLAMFAELESELKSVSVGFGLKEIYNDGRYPCPANLLGYVKDEKYIMKVEPEGAKTVRLIYDLFLAGYSQKRIAEVLTELSLPTAMGNVVWSKTAVGSILQNEKYFGAILMQKRYTVSFLSHKTRRNVGQKQLYYETHHHEAIVSEEEYTRTLLLLEANQESPFYNHLYEIRVIRKGLLAGFIPMNAVFGGYDAGHYLGSFIMARVPQIEIQTEVAHIAGVMRVRSEYFSDRYVAALTISRRGFAFNSGCISLMDTPYIEMLLHPNERLLAVRKTSKRNPNAIPWSNNAISAKELSGVLFELMGWQQNWTQKVVANFFAKDGEQVILFDLNNCEFRFRSSENGTKSTRVVPRQWLSEFGEGLPEHMIFCRRALANQLEQWNIAASPYAVEGFDCGFQPLSSAEAEKRIEEMRIGRDGRTIGT